MCPEGKSQVCVQCSFVQNTDKKSNETTSHENQWTIACMYKSLGKRLGEQVLRLPVYRWSHPIGYLQLWHCVLVSFFLPPEPMCAVGFGVAGLFSTTDKQSKQWNFAEYSLTGVWLSIVSVELQFSLRAITKTRQDICSAKSSKSSDKTIWPLSGQLLCTLLTTQF